MPLEAAVSQRGGGDIRDEFRERALANLAEALLPGLRGPELLLDGRQRASGLIRPKIFATTENPDESGSSGSETGNGTNGACSSSTSSSGGPTRT